MRRLQFSLAACAIAFFGGCAAPGLVWKKTQWEGPVIENTTQAALVEKCDLGPSGISDVTYCKRAFVDHRGNKVEVTEDIQKLLDDFMPQVKPLAPWVIVKQPAGHLASPLRTRLPYRLHILTISPVVVLAVPKQAGDDDYCSGRWPEQGCIPSRRFNIDPYWYKREPRARPGSFWLSPALGASWESVVYDQTEAVIDLPDSRLRLTASDGFWKVSRSYKAK